MKPILAALVGITLLLSACSEQAACISQANSELRVLTDLTAQTRANVARGYAIGSREVPKQVEEPCVVVQPDGSKITQICTKLETETQTFPVAIDLNAEQAKLVSLEQRLSQMEAAAQRKVAQCKAQFPE